MKNLSVIIFFTVIGCATIKTSTVQQMEKWMLNSVGELSKQEFVNTPLNKKEAEQAIPILLNYYQKQLLTDKVAEWDARKLTMDSLAMPFYYEVWGEKPTDGYSLFISMHGGGSTPKEVNDQQYSNQQHLYDKTMKGMEGVYLAPRAPTDDWNMWHKEHIDKFFMDIIHLAVLKEGVNPNKVYLMGYSAGGDGVYQLAPRMAPYLAAAAMMAGHPNEASAINMRNVPYTLHMGALDIAYRRNEIAAEWGKTLDSLQLDDPKGYVHNVQIHEGKGHWMQLEDAVALPWMAQFKRVPYPSKIVWLQDDVLKTDFYWLGVPENEAEAKKKIIATYTKNGEIHVQTNDYSKVTVFLNDDMVDLDNTISIFLNEELVFNGKVERNIATLAHTIASTLDASQVYSTAIEIDCTTMMGEQKVFKD